MSNKITMKKKVMLVNAPTKMDCNESGNFSVFPSLGVISLGTRLQRDFPKIGVKIADGGLHTKEEIKHMIREYNPDIIGLSVLTPTYEQGLEIAKYAKERGATTILGNDHASIFSELIMEKRNFIDYIVKAEFGEEPLSWIISKELDIERKILSDEKGDEKVFFRKNDKIKTIGFPKHKLIQIYKDKTDIPNLELVLEDLKLASKNYNKKYGERHDTDRRPMVINNVRGCKNGKKRCIYCSIYDLDLKTGNPNLFWETIKKYNREQGINFFYEVCDSFLSFPEYIKQLIVTKPFDPKKKDIGFEVYARADDIINYKDAINWFKELNILRVNLGLDSGDDNILRSLRKNINNKNSMLSPSRINHEAVKRLSEANISIHASFPLGSLGETKDSLDKTLTFIESITKNYGKNIATLEASELIPSPNSPSWDLLLSNEDSRFYSKEEQKIVLTKAEIYLSEKIKQMLRDKYNKKDILDINSLAKDWETYFTHINPLDIEVAKTKVKKLALESGAIYGKSF